MKKIKLFLICVLAVCMASCAFVACGGNSGNESSVTPESKSEAESESVAPSVDYEDGEYTLLDFESPSDLYKVRPYIPDILDIYGSISIVTDEEQSDEQGQEPEQNQKYAKSGKGSLKYYYESGTKPSLLFYPDHSAYPDIPVDKLLSFGVSIYSAAESTQSITLGIVSEKAVVYEETRELVPGRNDYEFELDPIILKFRKDEINAFCIGFPTGDSCEYYLDDWTATVGEKPLTETQQTAVLFAEKVDELDNGTPSTDGLLVAYGYYEKLDEACKSAVEEYYDTYKQILRRILDSKSWDKEDDGSSIVAYLSENYGILQVGKAGGMTYEYSSEAFSSGNGGTKFTFNGFKDKDTAEAEAKDAELKFATEITTATIIVDNYDFVEFEVKNSSDKAVSICFNGSANAATIGAGETITVELPATDLVEAGNTLTFAFKYKTGATTAADIFVSSMKVKAVSRDNVYVSALTDTKFAANGNAAVSRSGDKYSLTFNDVEAKVTPEKAYTEINVSQNVSFSVVSDKPATLGIYSANGEKITDLTVSSTAAIVSLTKEQYEELSYVKVSEPCVVTVSDIVLSRTVDNDYAEIVLRNDYVAMANAITTETAREAIYFVSSYENLSRSKQNYLKNNDSSVYSDIIARAEKISEVFKATVEKVGAGTASETENMLVSDLSSQYNAMKSVTALTKDELKIVETAKRSVFLKYKFTVFDFDNPMAASNFEQIAKWWDWSGNIGIEDFDGGKKLSISTRKVATTGNNTRRNYISYDISSVSSLLSSYDYVNWRIYNANSSDKTIFFITYGWSSTVCSCTLKANQWTTVKLSVSDFKNAGQFVIYPTEPGDKFYIDNVYACSAEYVQGIIDDLPELSELKATDREQVEAARSEYENLSAIAKKKVDATKLDAAEKRLSSLPFTVFDMSEEGITAKFTHPTDVPSYVWGGSFGVADIAYGKALAVKVESTVNTIVYLGYNLNGATLAGYDYVTFKIYNPKAVKLRFALITSGWGKKYFDVNLEAQSWNDIAIPVSSFINAGYFYLSGFGKTDDVTFYITDIIAESTGSVQAKIDDLPDADNVTKADTEAIMEARSAYGKLSDSAKASVDIAKLEAAEAKLAEFPYTLFDMSSAGVLESFTHPTDISAYLWDGDFSITDDETHGKVLAVHTTGTTGTSPVLYFGYNIGSADLSNYSKITVSVYNPKAAELDIAFITKGWGSCLYRTKLAPSGWTEITLTVDQFKSAGYVYIANVEKNEEVTFLITDFVAHN